MAEISSEFKKSMSEWVELKQQLGEARKDMKVLNGREKELKAYIMEYMKNQQIDNVNLKKGKVSIRTSKKKGSVTIKAVKTGLGVFLNNNELEVERAVVCIMDTLEEKETSVISLTGVNKK